ncbi:MAG TPA: hypothetical protein PKC58_17345 [Ignavibacteria bacterium]|nr:hypothetical protein [Ignavibacteria bacterium]
MKTNNIFLDWICLVLMSLILYNCALFTLKANNQHVAPILSIIKPENVKIFSTRSELNISKTEIQYLRVTSDITVDSLITLVNELPSLKYLEIAYGNNFDLDKLFKNIILSENISHLYIENLDTLCGAIGRFKNLEWLGINNSNLEFLPNELSSLYHLKVLNVGYIYKHFGTGNKLNVFPHVILELKNLEVLYMDNNALLHVPDSICNLTNLKILSLKNNHIGRVPRCLEKSNVELILN